MMNVNTKEITFCDIYNTNVVYENRIGVLPNGRIIVYSEIKVNDATHTNLVINYYSIDFTPNVLTYQEVKTIALYDFHFLMLDHNDNYMICFTDKQANFISCFEVEDQNGNKITVYSKRFSQMTGIDEFQMEKISNDLIIFGYTEGNNYNIFFLLTKDAKFNYQYSPSITICKSIGHTEFTVLSNYTIVLVRSGNTDTNI